MPRTGSKHYSYKDLCQCGKSKNQQSKSCWDCYKKQKSDNQQTRYDTCVCGAKKLRIANVCKACYDIHKRVDPDRLICPQCGGPKCRGAKVCERCRQKCQHCGALIQHGTFYCAKCREMEIRNGFCTCTGCKRRLLLADFWTRAGNSAGRQPRSLCKGCWAAAGKRHNRVRKCTKYGLTKEQAEQIADLDSVACSICGITTVDFHIDHCHKTNKARGLLCARCNNGLGNFDDDVVVMESAVVYLRRFEATGQPVGFP